MSAAPLRHSKPAISTDIGATRALYRSYNPASYKAQATAEITPSMTLLFRSKDFLSDGCSTR